MMEEEDHDELVQYTDDESLSESGDDQCIPMDKPEDVHHYTHFYPPHTKVEFVLIKIILIVSSTILLITLPLYQESINIKGDAYTLLYFNTTCTVLILLLTILVSQKFSTEFSHKLIRKPPIKLREIFLSSIIYTVSGFIIIYATDRKKVMCHIQDPIKGLVIVFSLIYYFFFCKKLMGLQRIFATTTIIVGLFIAVDYGLCNEFRCRGNDREHKSDDGGVWSWQTHSFWAGIYIVGLALYSGYFMLLDRFLICANIVSSYVSLSSQFLTTVSRLVSFQGANTQSTQESRPLTTIRSNRKNYSALHLAFWIHVFTWIFTVALFWIDVLPNVGKSTKLAEFFNLTMSGLMCIFSVPTFARASEGSCYNTSLYAWIFLMAYITYILSSLRFLILSQSAVHTVATTTLALPLAGIWWSLFKMTSVQKGLLIWSPIVSGELICALLGLPIAVIGVGLLCKSHFKDYHLSQISTHTFGRITHLT